MRNIKIFYLSILAVLFMVSCQKSYQVPDNNRIINTDSSNAGLLQKQVFTYLPENFENMLFEYAYDTAGRLIQRYYHAKIKNADGSIRVEQDTLNYYRDTMGRIIRIGEITDSIYLLVEYEGQTTRVKKVFDNLDSYTTEFEYGTTGHINRLNFYAHAPLPTDPKIKVGYHDHSYDAAGNMTEKTFYQDDNFNGNFDSPMRFRFEYDDQSNPRYPVDDALFPETWSLVSPNNNTRQLNFYSNPNVVNDTVNYIYTYDSQNRPVKCIKNSDTEIVYSYY